MQSRHQTEMAKGRVFLYLNISSIYIIIYSQFFLTVATSIANSSDIFFFYIKVSAYSSDSVSGLDCDRFTTFSKVYHMSRDIARQFVYSTVLPMLLLCTSGRASELHVCFSIDNSFSATAGHLEEVY